MADKASRTTYAVPPVIEVALSVAFQPIPDLGNIDLVRCWLERFRGAYPKVEEQSPFEMPIEDVSTPASPQRVKVELIQSPVKTRFWLKDEGDAHLLQLQSSFFGRNWRKRAAAAGYPRYPRLAKSFDEDLRTFQAFLSDSGYAPMSPTQVEVSYFNHVEVPTGKSGLGWLLRTVNDRLVGDFRERPTHTRYATQYLMTYAGKPVGRLHVSAEPAVRKLTLGR